MDTLPVELIHAILNDSIFTPNDFLTVALASRELFDISIPLLWRALPSLRPIATLLGSEVDMALIDGPTDVSIGCLIAVIS